MCVLVYDTIGNDNEIFPSQLVKHVHVVVRIMEKFSIQYHPLAPLVPPRIQS